MLSGLLVDFDVTIILHSELFYWIRSRGFYSVNLREVFHVKIWCVSSKIFVIVIVFLNCSGIIEKDVGG